VENFELMEGVVGIKPGRRRGKPLALKESYDHSSHNRRRCFFVSFQYEGKSVRLVEIDQKGLPGGCSTYILVAREAMPKDLAETVVAAYVDEKQSLSSSTETLARQGIVLVPKNHPQSGNSEQQKTWREGVLKKVCGAQVSL
jgi:hypothetical protein